MKEGPPSGVTLKGARSLTGRWKRGEEGEGRTAGHTPAGGQHRPVPRNRPRRTQGPRTVSMRLAWLSCGPLPVRASRGGGRGSPGGRALLSTLFVLRRLDRHVLTMEQPQGGRNRRGLRRSRLCGDTAPLLLPSLGRRETQTNQRRGGEAQTGSMGKGLGEGAGSSPG